MRFGGYVLEILVNDVPLPERPVKVETGHINFEPNYYVDETTKRKIFCDMHYIVEVTSPNSEFKIRFRSLQVTKTRIIRGDVAVDGKTDETCIEMYDKSFQVVTGFWKRKIHKPFKFSSKLSSIPGSFSSTQFGGPGAISVYFYEIEKLRYPTVKNLKINSKNYKELFWDGSSNLKSYKPIAVLHIHYRSTSWFNNILNNNHRRHLEEEENTSKFLSSTVTPSMKKFLEF